jgi:hypothetical protein
MAMTFVLSEAKQIDKMTKAELIAEVEWLRDLKAVGEMMSNLCFNGKQDRGIPDSYRSLMTTCQLQWDATLKRRPKVTEWTKGGTR